MNIILYTIICAVIIAFILGVLLGLFKKIFHVDTNPKVEAVRNVLSGANCGGCGLAGCDAFAGAVVKGDVAVNGCVAGGSECASKIAEILGSKNIKIIPKVAVVACKGNKECAADKGVYEGVKSCKAAQIAINGTKKCAFGCIGFGDCLVACPFNAIKMGQDGLPIINYNRCIGCGNCVKACPKNLIKIIEKDTKGPISLCSNKSDNRPQIKKDCSYGCIKCGICVKKCPSQCIDLSSGIPVIDYSKCTSCKECINSCPDKVLLLVKDLI